MGRRVMFSTLAAAVVLMIGTPIAAAQTVSDADGDLVADYVDNCVDVFNPLQFDHDADGLGDLCDPDAVVGDDLTGDRDSDLLIGTDSASTLNGEGDRDGLHGAGGDDTIDGATGSDLIDGGPGDDLLTGGPGCDVFGFDPQATEIDTITDFLPGVDRFAFFPQDLDPALDVLPPVTYGGTGTVLEITFRVDGVPALTIRIEGIAASTELALDTSPCGGAAAPSPVDIAAAAPTGFVCPTGGVFFPQGGLFVGTTGNDIITGNEPSDEISGDAYEEYLARGCDDVIDADHGTNTVYGDVGGADLGTGGNDTITAGNGNDTLIGDGDGAVAQGGDDVIYGGGGIDEIDGDGRDDPVAVGGDDELHGGSGGDTISGDARLGTVTQGGDDKLYGDGGVDSLTGDSQGDVVTGGDDELYGGDDGDFLFGESATGTVGDAGDDTLDGGGGNDHLTGDVGPSGSVVHAGSDTFVFDTSGDFGDDVIHDAGAQGSGDAAPVEDIIEFAGTTLADLVTNTSVTDNGAGNSVVIAFTGGTATGASVTIEGLGTGLITTIAAIEATDEVAIVTTP